MDKPDSRQCPNCHAMLNGASMCPNCGWETEAATVWPPVPQQQYRRCPNCGASFPADAQTCMSCGWSERHPHGNWWSTIDNRPKHVAFATIGFACGFAATFAGLAILFYVVAYCVSLENNANPILAGAVAAAVVGLGTMVMAVGQIRKKGSAFWHFFLAAAMIAAIVATVGACRFYELRGSSG
jgi:RNA polymerase subunit RPABC4/transcription elongation factor Spt4